MNSAAILEGINVLLAGIRLARELGVNYQEVIALQEQAQAEGREINEAELQGLIDQAQSAIDEL